MKKLLLGLSLSLLASVSFAQQVSTPAIVALACAYNSGAQTGTSGQFMYVQCDVNGKLLTSTGGTGVTAAAVLTTNQLVVGDDGARGVKTANATITGTYTFAGPTTFGVITNATSLALGGATIGTNALAVTGAANISGAITGGNSINVLANVNLGSNVSYSSGVVLSSGGSTGGNAGIQIQALSGAAVILVTPVTATLQQGAADAAVAVAQTTRVQSVVAGTAAANGANWTLIGSLPTGTGTSGDIIFQTGIKTGSGTTQGTATTALTIKGETQATTFVGVMTVAGATELGGTNLRLWNGGSFVWSGTGAPSGSADTGLSRISPGIVGVGTGAQGSVAGSLNLTNLTAIGATIILSGLASDGGATDATVCVKTSDGTILKGSGTLGICLGTSSERYKNSIEPLDVGLAQVIALRPVKYRLDAAHGDPNKSLYGFTAEQGGEVLPALMDRDAAGLPNTFDYLGVVPALVRAVQELNAKVDRLQR